MICYICEICPQQSLRLGFSFFQLRASVAGRLPPESLVKKRVSQHFSRKPILSGGCGDWLENVLTGIPLHFKMLFRFDSPFPSPELLIAFVLILLLVVESSWGPAGGFPKRLDFESNPLGQRARKRWFLLLHHEKWHPYRTFESWPQKWSPGEVKMRPAS